jgi:hypothetical protein
MVCPVQDWAESMVLWANMIYGEKAYQRVYDDQAARDTFLIAIPQDIQDEILIAARDLFPPVNGYFEENGQFICQN